MPRANVLSQHQLNLILEELESLNKTVARILGILKSSGHVNWAGDEDLNMESTAETNSSTRWTGATGLA